METKSQKLDINPDIHETYGFLILSKNNVLIATFSKEKKEINFQSKIEIIDIYNRRGGASAGRFRPMRIERNLKTFKFIEEQLEKIFIKDTLLNISGLIIAGNKEVLKLYLSYLSFKGLTGQLNEYITSLIEIEYYGELGFNEAIELSMLNN